VKFLARVQAERQAEVATAAQPLGGDSRRILVEDAEVLAQDLGERPVRGAMPVREAAAGALHGLPLLVPSHVHSSRASRDLPTAASPTMVTSRGSLSRATCS
jgi:hypothetical protein